MSLTQDIIVWRFAGAASWHIAMFLLLACPVWGLLWPGSSWASLRQGVSWAGVSLYLFIYALQFGVLFAHRMVLSASEAAPVHMPRLGLHGRSWLAAFLSRVMLRGRKMQDLIGVGALLGSACFCATTFLYAYPKLLGSPATLLFSSRYGMILGLLYTIQHLARCRDVLAYPVIQRHRYFRLRQQLPQLFIASVRIAAVALLAAAGLRRALPEGGIPGVAAALHAGSLCVFGWLLGAELLQLVFTERLRLAALGVNAAAAVGPASLRPALEALATPNEMVQDQVLQEVALVAEGSSLQDTAWRAAVFADETGAAGWAPLAGFLLAELRDFVATLAAALPATAADVRATATQATGKSPARMQWNVLSASPTTGLRSVSKQQDTAAWVVRARAHRVGVCMRALSALSAASRIEDRYGVVLLCDPLLADVAMALLNATAALQQYTRLMSSMTSRTTGPAARMAQRAMDMASAPAHPSLQQVEFCAFALEDLARRCTYKLVSAFGPALGGALKEVRLKPAYGSLGDASSQLAGYLTYQE